MWQTGNPGSLQPRSWRRELLKFPSCPAISLFFKNGREVVYWQQEMIRSFPSVPSSTSLGHSSDGLAFTRSNRSLKTSQSPEAILKTCEVPLKTVLAGAGHSHIVLFFMEWWWRGEVLPLLQQKKKETGVDGQLHWKGTHFCLLKETIFLHLTRVQSARLLPRDPFLHLFSQLTFSPSFPSLLVPACCAASAGLAWDLISDCGANEA